MNRIKEKVNLQNECKHKFISLFYQLSSFYNLIGFRNEALNYIYRWFKLIAKTENFQQLDFNSVNKILSSSELNICSELEIFNASDFWLSCESFDRSEISTKMFFKTRFPLLSEHVTKSLLEQGKKLTYLSSFHKNEECIKLMNEILKNKKEFYRNKSIVCHTNRYCNSTMFDLLISRNNQDTEILDFILYLPEAKNLKKVEAYNKSINFRMSGAASITYEVYFLFCNEEDEENLFIRHSPVLKTWEELDFFNDRYFDGCCMCSFIDSIFFIGGYNDYFNGYIDVKKSGVVYDTISKKWIEVAKMNDNRINAACTVFEGRVVVSGGENSHEYLRTVEAYDHVPDKWSYMPSMIHESCNHNMLAVSNKLFALGCGEFSDICEVYDSICKKFVVINSHLTFFDSIYYEAISIGRNILVFKNFSNKVAIYNIDKNEWSEIFLFVAEDNILYYCLKMPSLNF